MNFIYISPSFPTNHYMFCKGLKENGVRVLGIGDQPYHELSNELKASLDEYYYVHSLEDYEEKYRAVAYFSFKYGRIDYLESNNEYWLEDDARLRSDFNITTGPKYDEISFFKSKRKMKEYYKKAGVVTARYYMVKTLLGCKRFVNKVGFPVVVKPDNGVGAAATYKISNYEELVNFYNTYNKDIPYIMEEFIPGDLISFDGVCDANGDVAYPTHHIFPTPVMEIVNTQSDAFYYTEKDIPSDIYNAGQRVLKAFGAKSRFYHLEFFVLNQDKLGLGKKGDIIGLEVNMRVPGGNTADMVNYAHSINIYKIWADVLTFGRNTWEYYPERMYCAYVGRRHNKWYKHTHEEILAKYANNLRMFNSLAPALAAAMGDYFYIAVFNSKEEMYNFRDFVEEKW